MLTTLKHLRMGELSNPQPADEGRLCAEWVARRRRRPDSVRSLPLLLRRHRKRYLLQQPFRPM